MEVTRLPQASMATQGTVHNAPVKGQKPFVMPSMADTMTRFGSSERPKRTGIAGFFNWIGRVFNQFVLGKHYDQDKKEVDNPIPRLREMARQLANDYETANKSLDEAKVFRNQQVKELARLEGVEDTELKEAKAWKEELSLLKQQLGLSTKSQAQMTPEEQAEYEEKVAQLSEEKREELFAVEARAAEEAQQYIDAKKNREAQQALVEQAEGQVVTAENTRRELDQAVRQKDREIKLAEQKHHQKVGNEKFNNVVKTVKQATGQMPGASNEDAQFLKDVDEAYERSKVETERLIGSRDERARTQRVQQRITNKEALDALSALDELESATTNHKQAKEYAANAGGNPVDKKTSPDK